MTTRRNLIQSAAATALIAPAAQAHVPGHHALPQGENSLLEALMVKHLAQALGSRSTASRLVPRLFEAIFDWSYPEMPAAEADGIIAFSFGNRIAGDATIPGPVNARLADAVHAIRMLRDVPVYAQWEIAQVLQEKYGMDRVVSITPEKGADGQIVYLSTDGVAKAALRHAGSVEALGRVAVVGHRDHVKRCILVSRDNGLVQAAAVRDIALPVAYDSLSGQAWTRTRDLYLLSDMTAQLGMTRARLLADLEKS